MLRAVSPLPASGLVQSWGFYGLSADQTTNLAAGQPVKFTTILSGDIALSSYRFSINEPGTYRLQGLVHILTSTGTTGYMNYRWHDFTNSAYVGKVAIVISQNHPTTSSEQPIAAAYVSVTEPTEYQLLITSQSNVSTIDAQATYAEILRIA